MRLQGNNIFIHYCILCCKVYYLCSTNNENMNAPKIVLDFYLGYNLNHKPNGCIEVRKASTGSLVYESSIYCTLESVKRHIELCHDIDVRNGAVRLNSSKSHV